MDTVHNNADNLHNGIERYHTARNPYCAAEMLLREDMVQ